MAEVDPQHGRVLGHRQLQRPQDGAIAAQRDDELTAGIDAVGLGARPQVDDLEAVPRRPRPDRQQLRGARAGRLGEHAHGRGPRRRCQRERLHVRQRRRSAAGPAVDQSSAQARRRRLPRSHAPPATRPHRRGARRRARARGSSSRPADGASPRGGPRGRRRTSATRAGAPAAARGARRSRRSRRPPPRAAPRPTRAPWRTPSRSGPCPRRSARRRRPARTRCRAAPPPPNRGGPADSSGRPARRPIRRGRSRTPDPARAGCRRPRGPSARRTRA